MIKVKRISMIKVRKAAFADNFRIPALSALLTATVMFFYELLKEYQFSYFTKWQSHIMTICVTSFLSVVITFIIMKRREYYINMIIDENIMLISANKNIKILLQEKEILIKEVHHRVKNNLNTVYSLLRLQARNINDPFTAGVINDAAGRIQTMTHLYDRLYRSKDISNLSVKDYLIPLIDEIFSIFPNKDHIEVVKKIDDFVLDIGKMYPIGIIINELITNAMKYAFTIGNVGIIIVSAALNGKTAVFSVQDNGISIPESIEFEKSSGFGLSLVKMLMIQIDGSVCIERDNGTKVILEFNL